MPSDYRAIHRENERRYGTGVRDYGDKLLPHRYGDRTHFIYELLQNAEDALARRQNWTGPRSVQFHISPGNAASSPGGGLQTGIAGHGPAKQATPSGGMMPAAGELRVRHFGLPFDEADVRSICGIGESTKDPGFTEIGRFGIGFKSVYAFTDRPEVHSGGEDFALEHYVLPVAAPALVPRAADETLFVLPLRGLADAGEIRQAVRRLAPRALLFLREIEEIEWRVADGASGLYLRETDSADDGVRRVKLVGEAEGHRETEQTWLVFARAVPGPPQGVERHVEVAFRLGEEGRPEPVPERDTPLFAFFPTTLPTGLRFRVQGPFRTTLARDNVPVGDPWNESLVAATAEVLTGALRWLRDHNLLDASTLRSLPLGRDRLPDGALFAPLREAVSAALRREPLLPRFGGGFVPGERARTASPRWLRDLFGPEQLAALFRDAGGAEWLTGEVSAGRTDELSRVLQDEVGVRPLRLDGVLRRLDADFLEAQSESWVRELYEAFGEHGVRGARVADLPLVRLQDGAHVPAFVEGRPAAFLPGPPGGASTDLPVVHHDVLDSPEAGKYLRDLGLQALDPVELALRRALSKYRSGAAVSDEAAYARDIGELARAYRAGSLPGRRRLETELRRLSFVWTLDARGGRRRLSRPGDAFYATGPQRDLFGGLPAVRFVDDGCPALDEEGARQLLYACGARPLLEPFEERPALADEDREEIRSRTPRADPEGGIAGIEDWNLRGLDLLLAGVVRMSSDEQARRREMLRRELEELPGIHDLAVRSGKYECDARDGSQVSVQVPAAWMRRLTRSGWAPEARPLVQIGPAEPGRWGRGPAPVEVRPGAGGGEDRPDEEERERRLAVENQAIALILERERWVRAAEDNPGFDLYREDAAGQQTLLCEVKALSGTLEEHPARLTPNELRRALEYGENYWLYIVEGLAGDSPRILRIRNPAGAAARFAFGPEWRDRTQPPP